MLSHHHTGPGGGSGGGGDQGGGGGDIEGASVVATSAGWCLNDRSARSEASSGTGTAAASKASAKPGEFGGGLATGGDGSEQRSKLQRVWATRFCCLGAAW